MNESSNVCYKGFEPYNYSAWIPFGPPAVRSTPQAVEEYRQLFTALDIHARVDALDEELTTSSELVTDRRGRRLESQGRGITRKT